MLMNGEQYIASLKKLRPNIYKFGKLIEDVTTNPNTALLVEVPTRSPPFFLRNSPISGNIPLAPCGAVYAPFDMKKPWYWIGSGTRACSCALISAIVSIASPSTTGCGRSAAPSRRNRVLHG